MSVTPTVTLRDVALACGVHTSTICLALKNAPSIPVSTRRRIRAAAEALGYRPNVAARNLALLRLEKTTGSVLPIAWINQEPDRHHWRDDPAARSYYDAARRRAGELGYHLEEMWTQEPGMTPSRLVQIVGARGITGVIFPIHRSFDFALLNPAWNGFSLVGLNDHRLSEWVDLVSADHYTNTDVMLRRLRQLGFGRIGLALETQFDAATKGLVHACFLRHQTDNSQPGRVPVCFLAGNSTSDRLTLGEWLREHQPDTVICRDPSAMSWARGSLPNAAWIQLHGAIDQFDGGTGEAAAEIAVAAVDCVAEKMRRFDRGIRESTQLHLIRGVWHEPHLRQHEPETVVA